MNGRGYLEATQGLCEVSDEVIGLFHGTSIIVTLADTLLFQAFIEANVDEHTQSQAQSERPILKDDFVLPAIFSFVICS